MALKAFDDTALRARVQLSYDAISDDPFYPWVRPTDFVRALQSHSRLDLLLPAKSLDASKPILAKYWRRFRLQFPSHEAFKMLKEDELQRAIPVRIHGDEGRSSSAARGPSRIRTQDLSLREGYHNASSNSSLAL